MGITKIWKKLLLYNSYDTVNLQSLLKYCYDTKANEIYAQMKDATYQVELGKDPQQLNNDFTIESQNIDMPKILTKEVDNGYLEVYSNKQKVLGINRSAIQKTEIKLSAIIRRIKNKGFQPLSLGIDLTGSEKRPSGVCVLNGNEAELELLKTDQELISKAQEVKPTIISIDSPLSLPNGRCCEKDSCECRQYGITRECERILKRRGINVYPCLIQSMQQLTLRGMRLANILREQGFKVIESYPGAAQDILGLPRKRVDLRALEIDLMNMGINPKSTRQIISHDEIDALTSALVGYFYLEGQYEAIGNNRNDINNMKDELIGHGKNMTTFQNTTFVVLAVIITAVTVLATLSSLETIKVPSNWTDNISILALIISIITFVVVLKTRKKTGSNSNSSKSNKPD